MIPFTEWRAVYQPIYGKLADRLLYEAHARLPASPDPRSYRELVPTAARRALGEFYTPEWLADFVLDRAGYQGQPLLDPCCGGGVFLTRAGPNATGWDINPIAAGMARKRCPEALIETQDAFTAPRREFDFVVGNPPWVNWRRLSSEYRERIQPLWPAYGLFTATGLHARLGGAMDDLAALMTYACADRYLAPQGRLAFLLPAPLFHSMGGAGFRRFQLPGGFFLRPILVHEIEASEPFEGAATRPVLAIFEKSGTPVMYPVAYHRGGIQCHARPISTDPHSPWSVLPANRTDEYASIRGESRQYRARIGVHSGGAAGVYWIDILEDRGATLLIRNRSTAGKNRFGEVIAEVERALVYPLVRGRDLKGHHATASAHLILPHELDGKPVSESRMREDYPLTFRYFEQFRDFMEQRPHYRQHFAAQRLPYWSMYNVGPYTFARHRVAWREQSSTFGCAVLKQGHIADAKLIIVPCDSAVEAQRLAEFLNSELVRTFVESYVLRTQISTHVLKFVKAPNFRLA